MFRFFRQWPALTLGVLCLAVAVGLAEQDKDYSNPRAFLFAIGAILIGFAIGRGRDNDDGIP